MSIPRTRRIAHLLVAATAAATLTALATTSAFAAGGNGASFCSNASGNFGPGHAVQSTGNPLAVDERCNPTQ